ncbi:MAG: NfeD family protein [Pirellulaceae bacterium]|jgi:membrane-bound serine protease (ClpP class)|nr:NfeD family protein [Pirellulaceae bacterium]HJN10252.1 NfeD family protein [Pirellulaceae bacterium]
MDLILWAIALLLLGLSMLILEVFVPSGGVLSFLAVTLIVASVVVAFMDGFKSGAIMLITVSLCVPVLLWSAVHLWPHTPIGKLILAKRPAHPDDVLPETEAYRGLHGLIGKRGRAVSKMLPGGLVMIAGHKYDALSDGLAIDPDQVVQVIDVRTNRIVVRPAEGEIDSVDAMLGGTSPDEAPSTSAESADDVLSTPVESLGLDDLTDPLA